MSGWERITSFDGTDDDTRTLDAYCSEDKIVTGGGYTVSDERVIVLESLPTNDGEGWRVKAIGPRENWHLRAYALCAFQE